MSRRIRQRQPDFKEPASPRPFVSIVLVTYHTKAHLIENCLTALRKLDYAPLEDDDSLAGCGAALDGSAKQNFEVIIVDNASAASASSPPASSAQAASHLPKASTISDSPGEGTREALKRCVREEKLILNECNRGFSGGCNDGICQAKGEIIVLLNVDTEVDADWLTELVRPLLHDRRAAMAGCKMYYPPKLDLQDPAERPGSADAPASSTGSPQAGSASSPQAPRGKIQHAGGVIHPNAMVEHRGYGEEDVGQWDEEVEVDYVTGASVAIRREFLELCGGGLDEDYFPAYYEETDLCYRARLMGYRVLYAPRATLVHHESTLLGVGSPLFNRLCYRGRILFCLKNYRLRDWLFKFIPNEIAWLRAPHSKGFRRIQLRAYLDGLKFLFGHRYTPDQPFPKNRK